MDNTSSFIPEQRIEKKIHVFRGKKVMLDRDLAELYGVSTKGLNQAVKRNRDRFPDDFMMKLSLVEVSHPRSQFVTLQNGKNIKYAPYAFTELGIAMLSSILRSKQAVQINIQIMRTFAKLREQLVSHEELRLKIEDLERRHDKNFHIIFEALRRMMTVQEEPTNEIGFRS